MRCLYCGKELALLKRLTGGGDFCSDAHKQSYQEEYNRLALSRLLQAQKKGQQAVSSSGQTAPPVLASIAVEEPAAEPELEQTTEQAATPQPESLTESLDQAPVDGSHDDAPVATETADVEAPEAAEPEPQETAGFLLEGPAVAVLEEQAPYQEAWLEQSPAPAVSEWQFKPEAVLNLCSADLLALHLAPHASGAEDRAALTELSPQPWPDAQPAPVPSDAVNAAVNREKTANTNRFPTRGAIAIEISPSAVAAAADLSFVQAVGFETSVVIENSELLDLWATSIDFLGEDSDVKLAARPTLDQAADRPETALEIMPEPEEDSTPRASLEALSRLHEELKEREFAPSEPAQTKPPESMEAVPVEVASALIEIASAPIEIASAPIEIAAPPTAIEEPVEHQTVEITADQAPAPEQSSEQPSKPRHATELLEIQIRIFPPAKPTLAAGEALPNQTDPLLPNLKSLPLRPKVALAPGYGRPSTAPAATAVRSPAVPKPAGKPAARSPQPKPAAPAAKLAQSVAAKVSDSKPSAPPKPSSGKVDGGKGDAGKADAMRPVMKTPAPQPTSVQEASLAEKAPAAKAPIEKLPTEKAPIDKPPAARPAAAAKTSNAVPGETKIAETKIEDVPSFELAQPASVSWLGSLKLKLGIAIVLMLVACVYFLGWGRGKSHLPVASNSAVSSDGSGPSIIMGEGGWVEGWGGDPNGLHVGRQITIYRPSLKLSDYRLEFEASIDVRSVGWVFRAADPDDYYAMKLMTVSNGLSPKVALFKYLVANGRQTQVGRVPIELAVRPDTSFDIRVDVRGPQFTTFIQGQQVDSWTDDQLKIGGAGFLNEREERGKVKSVSIRYLSGAGK